jgi:hypothetical protein
MASDKEICGVCGSEKEQKFFKGGYPPIWRCRTCEYAAAAPLPASEPAQPEPQCRCTAFDESRGIHHSVHCPLFRDNGTEYAAQKIARHIMDRDDGKLEVQLGYKHPDFWKSRSVQTMDSGADLVTYWRNEAIRQKQKGGYCAISPDQILQLLADTPASTLPASVELPPSAIPTWRSGQGIPVAWGCNTPYEFRQLDLVRKADYDAAIRAKEEAEENATSDEKALLQVIEELHGEPITEPIVPGHHSRFLTTHLRVRKLRERVELAEQSLAAIHDILARTTAKLESAKLATPAGKTETETIYEALGILYEAKQGE